MARQLIGRRQSRASFSSHGWFGLFAFLVLFSPLLLRPVSSQARLPLELSLESCEGRSLSVRGKIRAAPPRTCDDQPNAITIQRMNSSVIRRICTSG
jgi:hypothetical protein